MIMKNEKIQISSRLENHLIFTSFQYYIIPLLYLFNNLSIKYYSNPWTGLWILYALVPVLDQWFIIDNKNPTPKEIKQMIKDDSKFKIPLYICCFADWASQLLILDYLISHNLSLINIIGIILIAGHSAASNFNIAHELFHKDNIIDKMMGTITMARNLYMHFAIEHVFGHHRHVATPVDPTSAHQGENLLVFVIRSIKGSYLSAIKYEGLRVQKIYNTKGPIDIHNRMIWFTASYFLIPSLICLIYGVLGAFYFLLIVIISIFQLETINYIEHYGLKRKEISKGSIFFIWQEFTNQLVFCIVGMLLIDLATTYYLSSRDILITTKTLTNRIKHYALMMKVLAYLTDIQCVLCWHLIKSSGLMLWIDNWLIWRRWIQNQYKLIRKKLFTTFTKLLPFSRLHIF